MTGVVLELQLPLAISNPHLLILKHPHPPTHPPIYPYPPPSPYGPPREHPYARSHVPKRPFYAQTSSETDTKSSGQSEFLGGALGKLAK